MYTQGIRINVVSRSEPPQFVLTLFCGIDSLLDRPLLFLTTAFHVPTCDTHVHQPPPLETYVRGSKQTLVIASPICCFRRINTVARDPAPFGLFSSSPLCTSRSPVAETAATTSRTTSTRRPTEKERCHTGSRITTTSSSGSGKNNRRQEYRL